MSYLAYDESVQKRVRLREFFPGTLSHREADGKTISVNPGNEIQYKALMTDFVELSRQLIALRTQESCLLRAVDILRIMQRFTPYMRMSPALRSRLI